MEAIQNMIIFIFVLEDIIVILIVILALFVVTICACLESTSWVK